MRTLNKQDCRAVSGGDGYRLVFVSVDVMDPSMSPGVSALVGKLLSGQTDPLAIADAINQAGGSLVEYLSVTPR